MTEQQAQNCIAYLELVRNVIDNAELRLVGAVESERPDLALIKARAEIAAAEINLQLCGQAIESFAQEEREKQTSASTVDGVAAGKPVVP